MSKRREPKRSATRKPALPIWNQVIVLQRICAGISRKHGIIPALVDLQEIRRVVDDAEVQAVAVARFEGRSWTEIGEALGVSRQAARYRFSALIMPRASEEIAADPL